MATTAKKNTSKSAPETTKTKADTKKTQADAALTSLLGGDGVKHTSTKTGKTGNSTIALTGSVPPKKCVSKVPLTASDKELFVSLQRVVRTGLEKMNKYALAVAEALLKIQEKKLFREHHRTFPHYCLHELNIARAYAFALAKAAKIRRDLESAMVDSDNLPVNERQIRPLTSLKDPGQQVFAWKRTIEIADGKPISEAHVRQAVGELKQREGQTPAPLDAKRESVPRWKDGIVELFGKHGFSAPFEQPFKWDGDVADLYSAGSARYVKIIDCLDLGAAASALVLKRKAPSSLIVINADPNTSNGLRFSTGEQPNIEPGSFSPAFHLIARDLDAVIEHEGKFYHGGVLSDSFRTTWTSLLSLGVELPAGETAAAASNADAEQTSTAFSKPA